MIKSHTLTRRERHFYGMKASSCAYIFWLFCLWFVFCSFSIVIGIEKLRKFLPLTENWEWKNHRIYEGADTSSFLPWPVSVHPYALLLDKGTWIDSISFHFILYSWCIQIESLHSCWLLTCLLNWLMDFFWISPSLSLWIPRFLGMSPAFSRKRIPLECCSHLVIQYVLTIFYLCLFVKCNQKKSNILIEHGRLRTNKCYEWISILQIENQLENLTIAFRFVWFTQHSIESGWYGEQKEKMYTKV